MLCGDFNAQCGSDADYIEGVDDIELRSIVDYGTVKIVVVTFL